MTTGRMSTVLRHLRGPAGLHAEAGQTDGHLLGSFIQRHDEAAFAALVRRHGPMVWGVCRRVLPSHHDAEDAFQATFLVLVRKAASITTRGLLANFLYGVAHRTALKARAVAARRRGRERQVEQMPEPAAIARERELNLEPLLDEELSRLPDKYRVPIVLCDLEGKTRKEAARQLGWPEGTVAGRLVRARALLARRLAGRGVVLTAAAVAVVLSRQAATAGVPAGVASAAVKAAGLFAAGKTLEPGILSAGVVALTEGVLKAMLITKMKTAAGACVVVGMLLLGSACGYQALAADKTPVARADNKLRDTLLVLDKQCWEATSKHDTDTLDKLVADDYVGLGGDGTRWTKASLLEQHRRVRTTDLKVLTEREVFRVNEQTAILTYEAKYRVVTKAGEAAGAAHQRMTTCWVQRDGGWFVAFAQCVDVPAAVATAKVEPDLSQLKPFVIDPNPFVIGPTKPLVIDPNPFVIGPTKPTPPAPIGVAAEKDDGIAWGKAVGGLQIGIGLRLADRHAYRVGDTVPLVLKVHNVSDGPRKITYLAGFEDRFVVVEATAGKPVKLAKPWVRVGVVTEKDAQEVIHRTLKPGEEIELGTAHVLFTAADVRTDMAQVPTVAAPPGKYVIGYVGLTLGDPVTVPGMPEQLQPLFTTRPGLATGTVEVEIKAAKEP